MTRPKLSGFAAELRDYALSLPETTEEFPWGEHAFKVKGKTFVFMTPEELRFSMKLPQTGYQALTLPFADPTHYGLGKHGWITFKPSGRLSRALKQQFLDWVLESYRAVAPKRLARPWSAILASPHRHLACGHNMGWQLPTNRPQSGGGPMASKSTTQSRGTSAKQTGSNRSSSNPRTGSTNQRSDQERQLKVSRDNADTASTNTKAAPGSSATATSGGVGATGTSNAGTSNAVTANAGTSNSGASNINSSATGMAGTGTSTGQSSQRTSATTPSQANQVNTQRTSGTNVANRSSAESSILPALMSNPWLMTNAFLSNPFGFARAMNQEMDRLFAGGLADVSPASQRSAAGSQNLQSLDVSRSARGGMSQWSPQVEVRHNGNQLTVCADLPGLSAKDVDVQVEDGILTISGERQQSSEDKQEGYYRSERSYGSFSRSIALPDGVNEDQIQAKFDNGVLEVTVPVQQQRQRGRRVEVQSGA